MFALMGLFTASYFTVTPFGQQSCCKKQAREIIHKRDVLLREELLGPRNQGVDEDIQDEAFYQGGQLPGPETQEVADTQANRYQKQQCEACER